MALQLLFAFILLLVLGPVVEAQTSDSLWTSFLPLAVRSPSMNIWMNSTVGRRPPTDWPVFYNGAIYGWAGHIRVDGVTWKWMGGSATPGGMNLTTLTDVHITPTRTILKVSAGHVDLTVTYFSPIEPSDPVKQSLPLSYLSVQVASADGQPHTVQIYSDTTGEWLSGDTGNDKMSWALKDTGVMLYHQYQLAPSLSFIEKGDHAQDLVGFHAMLSRPSMTYRIGSDALCRTQFANNGTLSGETTSDYPKTINQDWTVFAISVDLGTIQPGTPSDEVVWGVGLFRNPAIYYLPPNGSPVSRHPYWVSQYNTMQEALQAFMSDYPNAKSRADALDASILKDATAVSSQHATLVSLAARQALAGTELTVGQMGDSASNQWDLTDVKMFMKNIGLTSPGERRVSPVEGLYASFPFYLYLNASYGGYLLDPVLEFSSSGNWQFSYPPMDLGKQYPNATGSNTAHQYGVEHSGNMLIMTLAHARASGDGTLISKYYSTLKKWADYLVNNTSPVPDGQLDADGLSFSNSTNLAIKGIIGIKAMAEISSLAKQNSDSQAYSSKATAYVNTWQSLALSSDHQHILSTYGSADQTWALMYNLYADKLLGTGVVDQSIYQAQTAFLKNLVGSYQYGIPANSQAQTTQGNTAWTMFTAASVTDNSVRDALISPVWQHASQNKSGSTMPGVFHLDEGGGHISSQASPFVGGVFASLALNVASKTVNVPPLGSQESSGDGKKKTNVGPIVGGVIAAVGGLALIAIGVFFWWRRSRRESYNTSEKFTVDDVHAAPEPFPYESTPFYPEGYNQQNMSQSDMGFVLTPPQPQPQPQPAPRTLSAKALEHLNQSNQQSGSGSQTTGVSSYTTSSGPASSREPPTVIGSPQTDSALSTQEIHGLRAEVENLRRVMQSIQVQGVEPPPMYEHTPAQP